jgi:SPP1 family predicted phage head-tail adaptor
MLKSKYKISHFDRKVTIMKKTSTSTVSLGPKYNGYENIATDYSPWAKWVNKPGSEVVENDQITHIQQAVVTLRYRTDLTAEMVIVKDDKMYSILSISESGETRRRFLDLTVEYLMDYT